MSVELARLDRGDRLQGAGALVLFVCLFFVPWWGITTTTPAGTVSSSLNGWHTFTNSRWLWLLTVVAVAIHVVRRAGGRPPAWSISPAAVLGALGGLSAVLILFRILDHPSGSTGELLGFGYAASAGIKVGIWGALGGAIAITCGSYLQFGEQGLTLDDVRRQLSSAVAPRSTPAAKDHEPPADEPSTAERDRFDDP